MVLGAVLVIASLTLLLYNRIQDEQAGKTSSDVAASIIQQFPEPSQGEIDYTGKGIAESSLLTMEVKGQSYIGIIKIPSLGLSLPVQNSWNYPSLRISPCRYTGSAEAGTLIVAGHNYQRHFGRLHELSIGDTVTFADISNHVYNYKVSGIETISTANVQQMLAGNWDLTLFTCTIGGKQRVTVRCTLQQ
ncbi:MAG: sortase [Oscillospiraceae bacterium]|jgi:sortase A|nr:sortase [Oscillospiraceae bacterium]MDD3260494.1 sortase [Oscillospiraceae bacterium]